MLYGRCLNFYQLNTIHLNWIQALELASVLFQQAAVVIPLLSVLRHTNGISVKEILEFFVSAICVFV